MKSIIIAAILFTGTYAFAQCFPDRHSTNWFDAWVSCETRSNPNPLNGESHWILYHLKKLYEIDKIKIWNINDPDHLDWGMKDIRIEYSEDSVQWQSAGTFALDKAPGNNRYEGMGWIDVVIPKAQYVLITGLSNYGGSCSGIAEAHFSAEKIKITTDQEELADAVKEFLHIRAVPNPFEDQLRLVFEGDGQQYVDLQIADLFGKVLHAERIQLVAGYYSFRMSTKKWPSGSYLLIARKGGETLRKQLIKI